MNALRSALYTELLPVANTQKLAGFFYVSGMPGIGTCEIWDDLSIEWERNMKGQFLLSGNGLAKLVSISWLKLNA